MKKSEIVRDKLIQTTIDLMIQSNGDINEVTTRKITETAEVGVGLLNYHFKSKDKLIEEAVQQFISKQISNFRPNYNDDTNPIDKIKQSVAGVNTFLLDNESISKISILNDHINPSTQDNTMNTLHGIRNALKDYDGTEEEKNLLLFALISFSQNLFLRKDELQSIFGFDYQNEQQRNKVFSLVIERLFSK